MGGRVRSSGCLASSEVRTIDARRLPARLSICMLLEDVNCWNMISIVDCSSWALYEGLPEGSGRSEKQWLISEDGTVGLFKYPKIDPVSQRNTFEHVSEHLACRLGGLLGVKTARVDIASYEGRIGSISYLIVEDGEMLVEGLQFILGKHPEYSAESLQDSSTGEHYSIRHIFEAIDYGPFIEYWIHMLLFDFIIGNSDRHQSNWAYILRRANRDTMEFDIEPCPLYDNGSSLCCYVREDQLHDYLGNDTMKLDSLVDTRSRSIVRIDPRDKKRPRHAEVVRFLLANYPATRPIADSFLERLSQSAICSLVDAYQDELVSPERRRLLVRFLLEKARILKGLVMECEHE